jgi:hypothetical protein
MQALIDLQNERVGRIGRTFENLKKIGLSKVTRAQINTALSLMDGRWQKMQEIDEQLRLKHGEALKTHEYYTGDFIGQAEDLYVQRRTSILELEALSTPTPAHEVAPTVQPVVLPSVLPPPTRTQLPRVDIPTFSGKFEDWLPFRDLFTSLIIRDTSISDVTRMHYLRTRLKGDAELVVRELSTTEESFGVAWQALKDYYDNPRLLVRSYYSKYVAFPKLKTESAADLRRLYHCFKGTASSLRNLGRPVNNSEDFFVFHAIELLDPRSRRRWEDYFEGADPPSCDDFCLFLERRLQTLEALQPTRTETAASANKNTEGASRSTRTHLARRQETTLRTLPEGAFSDAL